MIDDPEVRACSPLPVLSESLNPSAEIPHGCRPETVLSAMSAFIDFLGFINVQLHQKKLGRLESMLMPANFSSIVGEFIGASLPTHCSTLVKNRHHNGHPDLLPAGRFAGDSILHGDVGIEIKASRYLRGWQGHNPERVWLMVFVFECNRPDDKAKAIEPKPFRFIKVVGAQLELEDWKFSGRTGASRRTITASVTPSGFQKMESNWIYRASL